MANLNIARGEQLRAFNSEAIALSGGATGFTAATIAPTTGNAAERAFVTVETAQMRFTYDGVVTPTSTVGHLANAGDTIEIEGVTNVANFKAIKVSGTSNLYCTYERRPS